MSIRVMLGLQSPIMMLIRVVKLLCLGLLMVEWWVLLLLGVLLLYGKLLLGIHLWLLLLHHPQLQPSC